MGKLFAILSMVAALILGAPSTLSFIVAPESSIMVDEGNETSSGAVADPGGPYVAMEGTTTAADGTRSRGSPVGGPWVGPPQVVNPLVGDPSDRNAAMARDSFGNVHVVWVRERRHPQGGVLNQTILYSLRLQNGSFTPSMQLDEGLIDGNPYRFYVDRFSGPSVATHGGSVYVAWPAGLGTVFFRRSTDGGANFEALQLVYASDEFEWRHTSGTNLAAGPSGRIYLAWFNQTSYNYGDILVMRSDDGGKSFNPPVRVNEMSNTAGGPVGREFSLGLDAHGNLFVAWAGVQFRWSYDLFLSESTDGGITFSSPVVVNDSESYYPGQPRIVVDPDGATIHVMWRDLRLRPPPPIYSQAWYAVSNDGGTTFSGHKRISDEPNGTASATGGLNLASDDNGTLCLFWSDIRDGKQRGRLLVSRDDGQTFSPSIRVDEFDSKQQADGILVMNDTLALLWTDASPDRVPGKDLNVMYAEGSDTAPIASYTWDMDARVDNDGDGDTVNDVDATGPTPTLIYGENGNYTLTLTVVDSRNHTASAQTSVTVLNVPPTIEEAGCVISRPNAEAWAKIAGEKWHDVVVAFYEDGVETSNVTMTRTPGSPDDQQAFLGTINGSGGVIYSLTMWYSPEDDPINGQPGGATPAWIILDFDDGYTATLHHLFNVNHPSSWMWSIPDLLDGVASESMTCAATASDPGSDDLTFLWEFNDGTRLANHHLNSNGIFPVQFTDSVTHHFSGGSPSSVVLTITDDDGGSTFRILNVMVDSAGHPPSLGIRIDSDWRAHGVCTGAWRVEFAGSDIPDDPLPPDGH